MTIEDISTVDAIGTDKVTGAVHLTITDHLPWDTDNHLHLLQKKINLYIGFIKSGEIYATYPHAKGHSLIIDVYMKFRPTVDAVRFLTHAEAVTAHYGALLRHGPFASGYADDAA